MMRKTAFTFLVLLVLLAFADIRFSIGGRGIFTLSLFEMWAYVSVLPMLAVLHLTKNLAVRPSKWLLLYLAWAWVSVLLFWDNEGYRTQLDMKGLIPGLLAYAFLLMAVESGREFGLIQKCWLAAGVVNACLALSQYAFSGPYPVRIADSAFEKLDLSGEQASVLVTGFFSHPNSFAQIMIPWFVVAGVAWLTSERSLPWRSWVWFSVFVLFGAVLLASLVKGAMLWSVAGILLAAAMAKWRRARSMLLFSASWVLLVALINAAGAYFVRDYGPGALGTLASRVEFIAASLRLFLDNPASAVMGGGMRFWESYADNWATWQFDNAHNVYINQALTYGFIGMFFLAAFIVSAVRLGLKAGRDGLGAYPPYPYIGALFAMTGEYFFEPSFNDPIQKYQLFFVIAALVLAGSARLKQPEQAAGARVPWPDRLEFRRLSSTRVGHMPEAGDI